ncbi:hypothetical protein [Micromonospora sp. DPT]|uniref:hypothetical protein n=1 Tax=Micromonospora sp. DPT TaxID=3142975 RepID=UPI00320B6EF1
MNTAEQHRQQQRADSDHLVAALRRVLAERERELLELKGPCSVDRCSLHYAHSGPCEIDSPRP